MGNIREEIFFEDPLGVFVGKILSAYYLARKISQKDPQILQLLETIASLQKWFFNNYLPQFFIVRAPTHFFYKGIAKGLFQSRIPLPAVIEFLPSLPGNPMLQQSLECPEDEQLTLTYYDKYYYPKNEAGKILVFYTIQFLKEKKSSLTFQPKGLRTP